MEQRIREQREAARERQKRSQQRLLEDERLLFDADEAEGSNFIQNISNYNSAFAFAFFGANIRPPPGRGPYCFHSQGQTYHYASNLHADDPKREDTAILTVSSL
ncbi:hypothetical protein FHG87_020328 [Trinorchestia longiramus]|nr:hypothetical protein FHG87_020328 [Trinorchestia longiramus]